MKGTKGNTGKIGVRFGRLGLRKNDISASNEERGRDGKMGRR